MGMMLTIYLTSIAPAHGQANMLSVKDCFSPVLVSHSSYSSETNWEWYYLSMVDETNYQQVKAATSASAFGGFFAGDFNYFQEQRRHYFEMHSESIKYYQTMSSNVSSLPPSWQPTIQKCIADTLRASSTAGLTYFVANSTPERFRLEIKYTSTESFYFGPWVKSSEIVGGYVEVDGQKRRSLYPDCWTSKSSFTCPNVNSTNEFIVIRDDPNKTVSIQLNLSNEKHSTSFDVEIVPKEIHCDSTYEGSKRETIVLPSVPIMLSNYSYGSGGWESTIWTARAIAPGKVTAIPSYTYSDPTNMHLLLSANADQMRSAALVAKSVHQMDITADPYWQNDVILFVGTQNGGPAGKTMNITAEYQLSTESCHDVDWK
jgi:hypothetical protein